MHQKRCTCRRMRSANATTRFGTYQKLASIVRSRGEKRKTAKTGCDVAFKDILFCVTWCCGLGLRWLWPQGEQHACLANARKLVRAMRISRVRDAALLSVFELVDCALCCIVQLRSARHRCVPHERLDKGRARSTSSASRTRRVRSS